MDWWKVLMALMNNGMRPYSPQGNIPYSSYALGDDYSYPFTETPWLNRQFTPYGNSDKMNTWDISKYGTGAGDIDLSPLYGAPSIPEDRSMPDYDEQRQAWNTTFNYPRGM